MITFLNTHLTKKQRIKLYRLCLLLDDMDFGYLKPVFFGTLLISLLLIGISLVPYFALLSTMQISLYSLLTLLVAIAFIGYLLPYIRKIRAKIRVRMNRRRKRATFTLFV